MATSNKKNMIFAFAIIIIGVILVFYFNKKNQEKKQELLANYEYAIAEVDFYNITTKKSKKTSSISKKRKKKYRKDKDDNDNKKATVKFQFLAKDQKYHCQKSSSDFHIIIDKSVKSGDKFLVAYSVTNPENCKLYMKYPIQDSTDFNKYVQEDPLRKEK